MRGDCLDWRIINLTSKPKKNNTFIPDSAKFEIINKNDETNFFTKGLEPRQKGLGF